MSDKPKKNTDLILTVVGITVLLGLLVTAVLLGVIFTSKKSNNTQKYYITSFTISSRLVTDNPLEILPYLLLSDNSYKTDHISLDNQISGILIKYKPENNLSVTISFDAYNLPNINTGELYDTNLCIVCAYFSDNLEFDNIVVVSRFSMTNTKQRYSITFKVNNPEYRKFIPTLINIPNFLTENDLLTNNQLFSQEPIPELSVTNAKIELKYIE